MDVSNIRKLQALIKLICDEVPFELNANKIAAAFEIGRDTVVEYIKYLGDAKVLDLIYSDKKKIGKLAKPDKVFMENPNLLHALSPGKVDSKYTFEIGGRGKDFTQIAGIPDSYIFADDWDMPDGAKLPLWMLGFLY